MAPKPLEGGDNPDVAENWMEEMETYFEVYRFTDEQKVQAVKFLLHGNSRKWWNSTSAPIITAQGSATWEEFRKTFREFYFLTVLRPTKTNELMNLKQGSMSIEEYKLKFFELLPYFPYVASSSEVKYDLFLQSLNPYIYSLVSINNDPTSYEVLVKRCRQLENTLKRNRNFSSSFRRGNYLGPRGQYFKKSDTGASHSFVSARFNKRYRLSYIPLDVVLSVSTSNGHSSLAKHLVLGCTLEFEGSELLANFMILAMEDFDCILGIDILTSYRATMDFYQKIFQFRSVEGDSWFFYGEGVRPLMLLVSALRAFQALETGFPPVREVEFGIELVPWMAPISRYYRRFIKNFLQIARPLTQLTRKDVPFVWSSECEQSFDELKGRLTTAHVLALPSGPEGYVIFTDASLQGLGYLLT
ncbi:uncharacterized protein [Henckelia pumila]|uniref:uncharacterized protein n=1 Tax=Henckelia pumila TaxID=405737 RepID=UPI003C6E7359